MKLTIDLLSDATFGGGGGVAGTIDVEVAHTATGLPLVQGKSLHGLLREAWLAMRPYFPELEGAGRRLLGFEGDLEETAILRVGDALPGPDIAAWAAWAVGRERHPLRREEILESLTDVRYQTAQNRATGAPETTTLRAIRVVLRGLRLEAALDWFEAPGGPEQRCLALCVLATRHAGLGRNRGRGHVRCCLDGDLEKTRTWAGLPGGTA